MIYLPFPMTDELLRADIQRLREVITHEQMHAPTPDLPPQEAFEHAMAILETHAQRQKWLERLQHDLSCYLADVREDQRQGALLDARIRLRWWSYRPDHEQTGYTLPPV